MGAVDSVLPSFLLIPGFRLMKASFSSRIWGLLLLGGLIGGLGHSAVAQDLAQGDAQFSQEGTEVVVTYDLLGEQGEEYRVNLLLSTSGGEAYDYEPTAVSGAVGEDVRPGTGKQIRWRVQEDFPEGFQHPNVQFKVMIDEQGGNGWLYVLGGSVLAGGGGTAAAILTGLIGGDSGGGDNGGSGGETIPPLDPNLPD